MGHDWPHLRLAQAARPHLCLLALRWLRPRIWPGMPLKAAATLHLLQAERQILRFMGATSQQQQAIDCYQQGLAAGFYALDHYGVNTLLPQPDAGWSAMQLQRLLKLGLHHGATLRRSLYGNQA